MSGQTDIRLASVKLAGQQDIDLLKDAARDIQNATEANFNHMKEKKWYKRLWEIVTFSRDNEKVVAKEIASLAQMQDIVIKVFMKVANESEELSVYL